MPVFSLLFTSLTLLLRCCNSIVISSAGCGTRKVCFSKPDGCDPAKDANCYFMSAVPSPGIWEIAFEIHGLAEGFVSFGFSDDQLMGNDDIYICVLDSNGSTNVRHAFSTGRSRPKNVPLGNVSHIRTSVMDGAISCSFISRNPISTTRISGMNSSHYLLFAYGSSVDGTTVKQLFMLAGEILFHGQNQFVSAAPVDIFNPQITRNMQLPVIIKAHGSLMLIAWMCTASTGMMIARYLKAVMGKGCCRNDLWFVAHVSLMSVSVAVTITAIVLLFAHVRGWSGGLHPILGTSVLILSLIQPLAAAFRCAPEHERRYIFSWLHDINAAAIKVLAVAAIFTGLSLICNSDRSLLEVMGGFVGWEGLFFLLQELHMHLRKTDDEENGFELISAETTLMILYLLGNLMFLVTLLAGISMM
ncbi:putative ferric-chelate reductase 1 [Pangasianodon hypophthalmus]|uniref:putative ferric-chelate reductase 1 n=1 Tax=Pangasianodon hypophthalmus TaxID=310915 RepID=UPI002307C675|nr:putative ferric-chelate reductase 1 [Pangasianodon hypophthalmus]